MSTVSVSIVRVPGLTETGSAMPVEGVAAVGNVEAITSDGTTKTTTITTPSTGDVRFHAWRIANMGSDNIWVAFGSTPDPTATTATAATTAKKGVPAGMIAYFTPAANSEKFAVTNA